MENDSTDAQQPQQPIEAEIVDISSKEVVGPHRGRIGKFDTLSPEILKEVDNLLLGDETIKKVREEMIQKYPEIEALKVSYASWQRHSLQLRGITKEVKEKRIAKKEIAEALPTTDDLQKAVSTVLNVNLSLENKKAALDALFAKIIERMAVVEKAQLNYLNPDLEIISVQYMKLYKDLLETVNKLQDTFNRDIEADVIKQLDEFIRIILTTVYQSYEQTHQKDDISNKFDFFRTTLERLLTSTLQSYKIGNTQK